MKCKRKYFYTIMGIVLSSCSNDKPPEEVLSTDQIQIKVQDSPTNDLISNVEKLESLIMRSRASADSLVDVANEIIKNWEPIERFDPIESEYDTIITAK